MTVFSIAGMLAYLAVMALALLAAFWAKRTGRPPSDSGWWLFISGIFALLALVRLFNVEESSRQALRQWIVSLGAYGERSAFQAPIVALIILVAVAVMGWMFWQTMPRRGVRRGCQYIAMGRLAVLGFALLYGLRIISLHATDALLYHGPLRLNWVIDGGLTIFAGMAASLYILRCIRIANRH